MQFLWTLGGVVASMDTGEWWPLWTLGGGLYVHWGVASMDIGGGWPLLTLRGWPMWTLGVASVDNGGGGLYRHWGCGLCVLWDWEATICLALGLGGLSLVALRLAFWSLWPQDGIPASVGTWDWALPPAGPWDWALASVGPWDWAMASTAPWDWTLGPRIRFRPLRAPGLVSGPCAPPELDSRPQDGVLASAGPWDWALVPVGPGIGLKVQDSRGDL